VNRSTPFIRWIEDEEATGELAEVDRSYVKTCPHRPNAGDSEVLQRPVEFLPQVIDFSFGTHFSKGGLDWRTKEMIATLVSA